MRKSVTAVIGLLIAIASDQTSTAQTRRAQYVMGADAVKFTPLDPKDPGGINFSVVSGQLQGKEPVTQPGKAPHGDECLANECLLLLQFESGFDFMPAGAK